MDDFIPSCGPLRLLFDNINNVGFGETAARTECLGWHGESHFVEAKIF
jgi:hypothetical protein